MTFDIIKPSFNFVQISNLIGGTISAASIRVPGKGWFLFGGNGLSTSQKLETVNSNWVTGPAVQTPGIQGQCVVQVRKNN